MEGWMAGGTRNYNIKFNTMLCYMVLIMQAGLCMGLVWLEAHYS